METKGSSSTKGRGKGEKRPRKVEKKGLERFLGVLEEWQGREGGKRREGPHDRDNKVLFLNNEEVEVAWIWVYGWIPSSLTT